MTLHIQDPTDPNSDYLVDVLLSHVGTAKRGGGAFAFMSAGGVKLLLKDTRFSNFTANGEFDLVLGVDAITDTAAMAALSDLQAHLPSLTAMVHIPGHSRSIFHPKFTWFETNQGGVLITGSGNLTLGGLRTNVEAFNVVKLNAHELAQVCKQWSEFKARSQGQLYTTNSAEVVLRLAQNADRKRREKAALAEHSIKPTAAKTGTVNAPVAPAPAEAPAEVDQLPAVDASTSVLVAEIPQSGNRWKQANFSKATFIDFFGASTTVSRVAYFFHIKEDGTVGEQEVRPAVVVVSQNYRFELDAATGIDYPANGRPIGVFVRIATRTFTYMLLLPNNPHHAELTALLDATSPKQGNSMRRIVFPAKDVQAVWPESPLWKPLSL